ncbi:MAG: threonylcarbamoyl-AMP synthase [Dehalococcoidales bacterium]|nr:threonylcarbamoyl-AMP synthase [Dehalococcoidales bacterium]
MAEEYSEQLADQIETGAAILKNGGVVAFPTDTVYGLGACLENQDAVKRVYDIKSRSYDIPVPLLLADISWLSEYALTVSPEGLKLAEAFFPGAVTLVMQKSSRVPDIITGGKNTIALRVPGHPVTLALIKKAGCALTGTSANLSGKPSALTADEVRSQIGGKIDYIIDGGKCPGGIESTIIDVSVDIPVLLREGAVPRNEIEKICRLKT